MITQFVGKCTNSEKMHEFPRMNSDLRKCMNSEKAYCIICINVYNTNKRSGYEPDSGGNI